MFELARFREEHQATRKEMQTSQEELKSANEELQTVNSELQTRVDALARASGDMDNLLNSTDIATLFLDRLLNVRRYTTRATHIIKLIPSDMGRPISDLSTDDRPCQRSKESSARIDEKSARNCRKRIRRPTKQEKRQRERCAVLAVCSGQPK